MEDFPIWTSVQRDRLREMRNARGMSQEQLADYIESRAGQGSISQKEISSLERGDKKRPSDETIHFLLEFISSAELPSAPNLQATESVSLSSANATQPLSSKDRDDLRSALARELPKQVGDVDRDSLKLIRQLADWALLPSDQIQDDLRDIFPEQK